MVDATACSFGRCRNLSRSEVLKKKMIVQFVKYASYMPWNEINEFKFTNYKH